MKRLKVVHEISVVLDRVDDFLPREENIRLLRQCRVVDLVIDLTEEVSGSVGIETR